MAHNYELCYEGGKTKKPVRFYVTSALGKLFGNIFAYFEMSDNLSRMFGRKHTSSWPIVSKGLSSPPIE